MESRKNGERRDRIEKKKGRKEIGQKIKED